VTPFPALIQGFPTCSDGKVGLWLFQKEIEIVCGKGNSYFFQHIPRHLSVHRTKSVLSHLLRVENGDTRIEDIKYCNLRRKSNIKKENYLVYCLSSWPSGSL
jgi:hypothetical protein